MTQVNSAQDKRTQLAWNRRATPRSLAQRRADFAAQMREMALTDLQAVASRLRDLHKRLERETDKSWTELEIATEAKVAYRTYQSWTGAKNENRDGTGYDKLARFYRRKLEDKSVTRQWIIFGDETEPQETPDLLVQLNGDAAAAIQRKLDEVLDQGAQLLAEISQVRAEQERLRRRQGPGEHGEEETGS